MISTTNTAKSHTAIAAVLLLVILLALYCPWLTGHATFYRNDSVLFDHPMLTFIGGNLKRGHLPLWNPYLFCGVPQVALFHPELFYPPCWLFACLPYSQALAVVLVFDQLISGMAGFLLVLDLGWGLAAASLAGLTFGLAGYFFSVSALFALHSNAAWFPFCLWCVWRLTQSAKGASGFIAPREAVWIAATAVVVCLFMLAGALEISGPGLLIIEAFLIHRLLRGRSARAFLNGNAAIVLGLLLAMPAIVPAAEWTFLSTRSMGLAAQEVFDWSTNWYDLLGTIAIQPLGDLSRIDNVFQPIVATCPVGIPFIASLYVSPIVLTLACWGMCRRFRGRWALLVLLLVTVVLSMGIYTPVAPYLVQALHLTSFRYPIKLMYFTLLPLALLAAAGMQSVSLAPQPVRSVNRLILLVWLFVLAAGLWCVLDAHGAGSLPLLHNGVSLDVSQAAASTLGIGIIKSASAGIVACALGELIMTRRIEMRIFAAAIVLMQAVLLATNACAFAGWAGPPDFYSTSLPLKERLLQMHGTAKGVLRVAFVHADMVPDGQFLRSGDPTTRFFQYRRQTLFFASNIDAGIGSMIMFIPTQTKDCEYLCWAVLTQHSKRDDAALARYCQITGTPIVVTAQTVLDPRGSAIAPEPPLDQRYFDYAISLPSLNTRIYKVRDVLPRAYLAERVKWGSPHQACLDFVAHSSASGFDPHLLTLLEHAPGEIGPQPDNGPTDSSVLFVTDTTEKVELEVKSAHKQFLVLCDQYYPGWRAYIDQAPVKMYRANILSRAVFVPAGKHRVRFVYQPDSLAAGLITGAVAALMIICLTLYWKFRA